MIVVLGLQPLSRLFQGYVGWDIIDPASNHVGWYMSSLQHWALHWVWPSALILSLSLKSNVVHAWLVLVALCVLARGEPDPFYQGSLTSEERWLIALTSWYTALALDAVVAAMAVAVSRLPCLILIAVPIAALRIFF